MTGVGVQLLSHTVMFLLAGAGCLVVGALILNNVPVGAPPGLRRRLHTYLTRNVAETRANHPFPELELPYVPIPPGALFTRLELTVELLGWELVESDARHHRLHAVAETALLRFKDDIIVQLEATNRGTAIHIQSSSRVGKADLGANTRHILDLLNMLGRQV